MLKKIIAIILSAILISASFSVASAEDSLSKDSSYKETETEPTTEETEKQTEKQTEKETQKETEKQTEKETEKSTESTSSSETTTKKPVSNNKEITEADVTSIIEDLTNIKILSKNDYNQLCTVLDKQIYGQDLTKLKTVIKNKFMTNKICAFEIRGERGTGKSFTAKLIASTLKYNLIELDMKEYSSSTAINRLIGSDPGYVGYEEKSVLDKVKYNPYSLILLKNIEYAHPNIVNLFNSISEKGYLIDKKNNKIDFNLTMIIKTGTLSQSKIGYQDTSHYNDSIIHYKLIYKKDIKKYLLDNNLNQEYLKMIEPKTTFNNLHSIMNEVSLNN